MNNKANCPVCDFRIECTDDPVEGELMECFECGSELEIISLDPIMLMEAPEVGEDWGE